MMFLCVHIGLTFYFTLMALASQNEPKATRVVRWALAFLCLCAVVWKLTKLFA